MEHDHDGDGADDDPDGDHLLRVPALLPPGPRPAPSRAEAPSYCDVAHHGHRQPEHDRRWGGPGHRPRWLDRIDRRRRALRRGRAGPLAMAHRPRRSLPSSSAASGSGRAATGWCARSAHRGRSIRSPPSSARGRSSRPGCARSWRSARSLRRSRAHCGCTRPRDERSIFAAGDVGGEFEPIEPVVAAATAGRFLLPGPAGGPAATIEAPGWRLDHDALRIDAQAEPGETWRTSVSVVVDRDGTASAETDEPRCSTSKRRHPSCPRSIATGRADLRALTIPVDELRVFGAGSPFFLALFGRDSLMTGIQALLDTPARLTDILTVLARRQATTSDDLHTRRTRPDPARAAPRTGRGVRRGPAHAVLRCRRHRRAVRRRPRRGAAVGCSPRHDRPAAAGRPRGPRMVPALRRRRR